jgi:hypothetical protein
LSFSSPPSGFFFGVLSLFYANIGHGMLVLGILGSSELNRGRALGELLTNFSARKYLTWPI